MMWVATSSRDPHVVAGRDRVFWRGAAMEVRNAPSETQRWKAKLLKRDWSWAREEQSYGEGTVV
jgi:hypothetical protein